MSNHHDSPHNDSPADLLPDEDPGLLSAVRRASSELPSVQVDAAILAAARRAVHAGPSALGRTAYSPWRMPFAAAAVLVLSFTVVYWNVRDQGLENLSQPVPPSAPANLSQAEAPAPTQAPVGMQQARNDTLTDAPRSAHVAELQKDTPDPRAISKAASQAPAAKTIRTASKDAVPAEQAGLAASPPSVVSSAGSASVPPAPHVGAAPAAAPAVMADSSASVAARDSVRAEAERAGPVREEVSEPSREGNARKFASASATRGPVAASASASASAPAADSGESKRRKAQSPSVQTTVDEIRRLLAAGADGRPEDRASALSMLTRLRREHPDYVLPADLRALAEALPTSD